MLLKKKYTFQVVVSILIKGISVLLNLWQISILFHTLDKIEFSVWVTIISITNWILLFDIGIGNSLRSKVSLLIHTNKEHISNYVSNAYALTFIVFIILLFVDLIIYLCIDWNYFYNTNYIGSNILGLSTFWGIFAVSINQFFSLISQLYHSIKRSELSSLHSLLYNFFFCVQIYFFSGTSNDLYLLSLSYLFSILVSGFFFTIFFFNKFKEFRPSLKKININTIYQLTNIGFVLLFVEIAPMILNFSNNIFIARNLGIEKVGVFNIVFRVFFSISTTSWLIIVPFWAYTSENLVKKDFNSIKVRLKNLKIILLPISFILFIVSLNFDKIIYLWMKKEIHVDSELLLFMSIFVLISYWNTLYIFLFNGLNKYKYNTVYTISILVLIWPLSYWLSVVKKLDTVGVIQASIISMLPYLFYSLFLSKSFLKDC